MTSFEDVNMLIVSAICVPLSTSSNFLQPKCARIAPRGSSTAKTPQGVRILLKRRDPLSQC